MNFPKIESTEIPFKNTLNVSLDHHGFICTDSGLESLH